MWVVVRSYRRPLGKLYDISAHRQPAFFSLSIGDSKPPQEQPWHILQYILVQGKENGRSVLRIHVCSMYVVRTSKLFQKTNIREASRIVKSRKGKSEGEKGVITYLQSGRQISKAERKSLFYLWRSLVISLEDKVPICLKTGGVEKVVGWLMTWYGKGSVFLPFCGIVNTWKSCSALAVFTCSRLMR